MSICLFIGFNQILIVKINLFIYVCVHFMFKSYYLHFKKQLSFLFTTANKLLNNRNAVPAYEPCSFIHPHGNKATGKRVFYQWCKISVKINCVFIKISCINACTPSSLKHIGFIYMSPQTNSAEYQAELLLVYITFYF